MHYYQFNIGDYAKSTNHLDLIEDLIYRRLLDLAYDTEKPLSPDIQKTARLIGLKTHEKETKAILDEFFKLTKNGYIQKRVQKELSRYSAKADAARANGKKGGRPKKTQSVNLANPVGTQEKAKQEPITNNHKPTITLPSYLDASLWDDFLDIRTKLKAKNTDRALKTLINQLEEFRRKGHDPNKIIETSVTNSWKGVFEPKGGTSEKPNQTFNDTYREHERKAKEYLESLEREDEDDGDFMGRTFEAL